MILNNILNGIFGDKPAPKPPATPPKPTAGYAIPPNCWMQAKKVVSQFDTIGRSYNIPIWAPQTAADHQHDWGVMLAHGDLQSVRLELLAADKTVLFEFRVHFQGEKAKGGLIDSASGVELPLLDRAAVTGHRLIIQQNGRESVYRHLLRISWSPAPTLQKRPGDSFASEHARKITGGRQTASVHVTAEARQRLVVTQTGDGPYAFGEVPARFKGIFLHRKFAPPGFQFRMGQQLSAVLVQTPRGLQARAIQMA